MRGALFERQKKYDASEEAFRKVLALNPDHAGALNYLGYMLADRNVRLDEAYQMIQKAVDLEPENGAYLDSLGWVYYRQGKLTEAEGLLDARPSTSPARIRRSTTTWATSTSSSARRRKPSRSGRLP